MAVTRARKSSINTPLRYSDSGAGNYSYPWSSAEWSEITLVTPYALSFLDKDAVAFAEMADGRVHGVVSSNGPGSVWATTNGGLNWSTTMGPLGYSTYVGSFNGAIFGGGNYITSSAGYTSGIANGWTYITGLQSLSGYNFGPGGGGWTTAGRPVYVLPYSFSTSHRIAYITGDTGSSGIPSSTWNNSTIVHSVAGNGYQARVALTNDILVYAGYSNSTPSTGTFFVRYATVDPNTGAPGAFSTGTITITGLMKSLRTVNGVFILSTADGKIYTSTNGATWTQQTSPFGASTSPVFLSSSVGGRVVAFTDQTLIAHQLYYTENGTVWTAMGVIVPIAGSGSTIVAIGATENGLRWVLSSYLNKAYRNENYAG